MGRFLSTDNPVMAGLNYIINIAYVSVLWFVFSIPVVTAGASATAAYYTVTKVIRHDRGYIFKEFWHGFKSNLKQSTGIWAIYLLVMGLLAADIRIMANLSGGTVSVMLRYVFLITMLIATAIVLYALAYTARFTQDIRHIFLNSALMALRHFPKTLLLVAVTVAAALAAYLIPIAIFLAPGIAALLASFILESIFVRYMSEEDRRKEDMLNHPEQYEYVNREDEE